MRFDLIPFRAFYWLCSSFFLSSCFSHHPPASEAYFSALIENDQKMQAQQLQAKAEHSKQHFFKITFPYLESQLFEQDESHPSAFSFALKQGQRLQMGFGLSQLERPPFNFLESSVIIDLYVKNPNGKDAPQWKYQQTSLSDDGFIEYIAKKDGVYLLQIVPTLQSSGRFDFYITSPPRLRFPVDTASKKSVQSLFGAKRDGGKRRHEGVDIFEARGTSVLASDKGLITKTATSPRGGKHVWLRTEDLSLYYAHLDSILVSRGQRVEKGEVIGTVGNTGNARTTPPHLHFGVYKRFAGAIDPLPLIGRYPHFNQATPQSHFFLPRWMSVKAKNANVRSAPSVSAAKLDTLSENTLLRVDGVSGDWARVSFDSDKQGSGYIAIKLIGKAEKKLSQHDGRATLYLRPDLNSTRIGLRESPSRLAVLGKFNNLWRVETPQGLLAWAELSDDSDLP